MWINSAVPDKAPRVDTRSRGAILPPLRRHGAAGTGTGVGEIELSDFEAMVERLPTWGVAAAIFLAAGIGAFIVHAALHRILTRAVADLELFWRSLVSRTRNPLRLLLFIGFLAAASAIAPLNDAQSAFMRHALLIAVIALIASVAATALHIWSTVYLRRFTLDAEDNLLARKHVTQTRILRRVADTLIVVIAFGAILMTFEEVRQYGVSLLASAGAAGLIIGLALQTVLRNLFAGIQLAITQPIRLDDVVIVEGEWGNIEEITSTYVVVRIWDLRRLIVPLSYFIEKPFQNWTREDASLIGSVPIWLDYAAPIDAIRETARSLAEESPLWDGEVFSLQVIDFTESTMQLRVIVGARNAGDAWNLRCQIREGLITYLQREHPGALPKARLAFQDGAENGPRGAAGKAGDGQAKYGGEG